MADQVIKADLLVGFALLSKQRQLQLPSVSFSASFIIAFSETKKVWHLLRPNKQHRGDKHGRNRIRCEAEVQVVWCRTNRLI